MSKIQAILFDRRYWNIKEINDFLYDHNLTPIKQIHMTPRYYRARLKEPRKDRKYRTKIIKPGLKFIIVI